MSTGPALLLSSRASDDPTFLQHGFLFFGDAITAETLTEDIGVKTTRVTLSPHRKGFRNGGVVRGGRWGGGGGGGGRSI